MYGMFLSIHSIDDTDIRTYREILFAFLQLRVHGNANAALIPEGSTIVLRCVKMILSTNDRLHGGRLAADVGLIKDRTVFLTYPVTLAIAEVPTKKFSFYCTHHVGGLEALPPPSNALVFLMTSAVSHNTQLPCARLYRKMTRKDTLYDDFRGYLREQGVGCFPHDIASSLGDDFLSNLSAIFFPLSCKVWQALNDKHNRGGVAPEQEFDAFFGSKVYCKKADRPNYSLLLEHI